MNEKEKQKVQKYEEKRLARIERLNAETIRLREKLAEQKAKLEEKKKKRKKKSLDEYKGYYFDISRGVYRVQFSFNGKRYRLGTYPTHWEAHAVYVEEKSKLELQARIEAKNLEKEIEERREKIKAEREAEENSLYVPPEEVEDGDIEYPSAQGNPF